MGMEPRIAWFAINNLRLIGRPSAVSLVGQVKRDERALNFSEGLSPSYHTNSREKTDSAAQRRIEIQDDQEFGKRRASGCRDRRD